MFRDVVLWLNCIVLRCKHVPSYGTTPVGMPAVSNNLINDVPHIFRGRSWRGFQRHHSLHGFVLICWC